MNDLVKIQVVKKIEAEVLEVEETHSFDLNNQAALNKQWMLRALNILARREHSAIELKTKLLHKQCPCHLIDPIMDKLIRKNHLSSLRFAQAYAHNKAMLGYGPHKVHLELDNLHQIPIDEIKSALDDTDWAAAKLIALRKIKHSDPYKQKQALYLRGF